ncbi:MAG: 50S ribosomal protein L5 [Candidatus Micrarchaeaceae archaeon]|jgi:ribosomal protein L5
MIFMDADNSMRKIKISKVVINIGTGSDEQMQSNAKRLIEIITGRKAANELSRTRNPAFKIAKGQKIGAFVTVRGTDARSLIVRLFEAIDNKIKYESVTNNSLSFGIPEYIDISGVKYDSKVGMLGMNVNVSFMRNGMRVSKRKLRQSRVHKTHRTITPDEIMDYIKNEFNVRQVEQAAS